MAEAYCPQFWRLEVCGQSASMAGEDRPRDTGSPRVLIWWKRVGALLGVFNKGTNPFQDGSTGDLLASQRPYLLGLGVNMWILRGCIQTIVSLVGLRPGSGSGTHWRKHAAGPGCRQTGWAPSSLCG